MRDIGGPDNELTKALWNDDIEKLKSFDLTDYRYKQVTINIFDSIVENYNTNILKYAAAYGSIKCFKYLLEKKI